MGNKEYAKKEVRLWEDQLKRNDLTEEQRRDAESYLEEWKERLKSCE